jgi:hypothetical protein
MFMDDGLFWNASPEELMMGYTCIDKEYVCLVCEKTFQQGVIYPVDDRLLEARLAVEAHIAREHGSMFQYLLGLDKKFTGLSEVHQQLLASFHRGETDKDIAASQGISASTVRNHRFKLKEKERQARVFLALMGLLDSEPEFVSIHKGATMVDDRYAITLEEEQKLLNKYIKDGKLSNFPIKQKRKLVVLRYFVKLFDPSRFYSEKEVNQIIKEVYDDYVTIRRYLIEYGFMERNRDGSDYRLTN